MVHEQNTRPFPRSHDARPTFRQLRERHHLSYFELAQQSKVRVCRVYWMELGYRTEYALALQVMGALSQRIGQSVRFEQLQGIRLKSSQLEALVRQQHTCKEKI